MEKESGVTLTIPITTGWCNGMSKREVFQMSVGEGEDPEDMSTECRLKPWLERNLGEPQESRQSRHQRTASWVSSLWVAWEGDPP